MTELIDELRRADQQRVMDAAEGKFRTERIGLFALDAYARARNEGLPIPEWILGYFDEATRSLGKLVDMTRDGKPLKGDPSVSIAAAFLLKSGRGKPTVFRSFVDQWYGNWEYMAIGENVAELERGDLPQDHAIDMVAYYEGGQDPEKRDEKGRPVPPKLRSKVYRARKKHSAEKPDAKSPIS
jgi:hypothetical protein